METNNLSIKKFRKDHNITQEKLAELVGVSFRTIQNYEAGLKIPNSKTAIFRALFKNYGKEKEGNTEDFFIDVSEKDKLSIKELSLIAAQNIDKLKKEPIFYNTFVMEALNLIKEVQNKDGSIDPMKIKAKG